MRYEKVHCTCPVCGHDNLLSDSYKQKEEPDGYRTLFFDCEGCGDDFDAYVKVLEIPFAKSYRKEGKEIYVPMLSGNVGRIVSSIGEAMDYLGVLLDSLIECRETIPDTSETYKGSMHEVLGYMGDMHVVVEDFLSANNIELICNIDSISHDIQVQYAVDITEKIEGKE